METLRIDPHNPDLRLLADVAARLREGAIVVLPTDTVYGIGVAVLDGTTPERLYEIKGRDEGKAIPLLVSGVEALAEYGEEVPQRAVALAEKYWPGALTLVVKASERVPTAFRARDGSIALRAPAHAVALSLIKQLGAPLATSSANLQGEQPALSAAQVDLQVVRQVDFLIDSGVSPGAIPSTIVSFCGAEPQVIREGAIPAAKILLD